MHFSPFLFTASILAYSVCALPVTYPEALTGGSLFNGKAAAKSPYPVARNLAVEAPLLRRDGLIDQASILLYKRSSKGKGKAPARPPVQRQPATHRPAQRKVEKAVKKNAKNQRPTAKKAQGTHPKGGSQRTACMRRVRPRNLFGRASTTPPPEGCEDFHITEHGKDLTVTIKGDSENLGGASANNAGVYEIKEWGERTGPFIAKKFFRPEDRDKEAKNLRKVGHLIAKGDSPKHGGAEGTDPWVVTKLVPGSPLIGSKEHTKATSSSTSKADCVSFLEGKHDQLVEAVVKLHRDTKMIHGDLKNENIHWKFDNAGKASVHLLDFGMMTQSTKDEGKLMRHNIPDEPNKSVHSYALARARKIYPLSHCRGQ
ncbi:hypothetical protein BDZ97DRAFT_1808709 [Flammula alnicola]|nr:hypothetical protein BDZ97DRAFT_1808709 [Flammula alnicola]